MRWAFLFCLVSCAACGRGNFEVDADTDTRLGDASAADAPHANYAFVTSNTHNGNLGGLAGADATCQARAGEAGLPGTYIAYLSDPSTNAIDRLMGSRGWQRVDGKPFIDLPAQLTDQLAWYPLALDELGNDVRGGNPSTWTGAKSDGTDTFDCVGWTSQQGTDTGGTGVALTGGPRFASAGIVACNTTSHLYCFELGKTGVAPPPRVAGPVAFVTNSAWAVGPGIADADSLCQAEAGAAGLAGTFLAVLGTDTTSAESRFTLVGAPWVRPDGVPVVATRAEMFTGALTLTQLILTATAQPLPATQYWAGFPAMVNSGATCANWTAPGSGIQVGTGTGDSTSLHERYLFNTNDCNIANSHLLCLQSD